MESHARGGRQELYNGNGSMGNDLAQRDLEAWQES